MTIMKDGRAMEVATIGNEGLGSGRATSPNEVMVQVVGEAGG